MTRTYLLEIGLEELPANAIQSAEKQLVEKTKKLLDENHLSYGVIQSFSTPRRLAVIVNELAEKQPDETLIVRGPAKRIAQDEDGNWTPAAIGFSKGQGGSVEELIIKEDKGEPYVFIEKFVPGKVSVEILKNMKQVIKGIEFPKHMKWGNTSYQYGRPIHWLVSLLDEDQVSLEVFDVESGNKSMGHRFLGDEIVIQSPQEYEQKLTEEYVIADRSARQAMIVEQIEALCAENNWTVPNLHSNLLEEVTDLVEYPTAFYGSFDETYLEIPTIVLETSMIDHQRYFPVWSAAGDRLLPHFISVRNGKAGHIENVARGNEKVLSARLADGKFFYEEDQRVSIADSVEKLKILDYHEKIGTIYDKQVRVNKMAEAITDFVELTADEQDNLERVSSIYKFDLVTQMVGEFPDLQGTIGKLYAEERGETVAVSEAIGEQYLPLSAKGKLPEARISKVLALLDKLDSLIQFFSAGLIPTGSNDPYALRRQAIGVVRIILALKVEELDLTNFLAKMIAVSKLPEDRLEKLAENKESLLNFILNRLEQIMQSEFNISHDIRQAALGTKTKNMIQILENAKVLEDHKESEQFKELVESITRVSNLTKSHGNIGDISEELLETTSERELVSALGVLAEVFSETGDAVLRYQALSVISPYIDHFFEENMIMVDDEAIKENRLTILHNLAALTRKYADFSQIVI